MWRYIDVQADRRSWTYGRAPNAIDISWGSLTYPPKHRHGTTLFCYDEHKKNFDIHFSMKRHETV